MLSQCFPESWVIIEILGNVKVDTPWYCLYRFISEKLGCGLEVCKNPHLDEVDQQEGGDPAAVQLAVDSTQALVQTGKSIKCVLIGAIISILDTTGLDKFSPHSPEQSKLTSFACVAVDKGTCPLVHHNFSNTKQCLMFRPNRLRLIEPLRPAMAFSVRHDADYWGTFPH